MNVRPATEADDAVLVDFGRHFYATLPYQDVPYCEESATRWFAMMRDIGVLLVAEVGGRVVGMAGGLFSPFIFNDAFRVGGELLWWVEPLFRCSGVGAAMLGALERSAAEAGCIRWSMVATNESPAALERVYAKAGYTMSERSFTKVPQ